MAKRKKEGKQEAARPDSAGVAARYYNLIIAPLITEKSSLQGGDRRRIIFKVSRKATKPEIREAVEKIFGVQVQTVRTCNVMGKVKRTQRSVGRRPGYKKAYITLKAGHAIDIVEGV